VQLLSIHGSLDSIPVYWYRTLFLHVCSDYGKSRECEKKAEMVEIMIKICKHVYFALFIVCAHDCVPRTALFFFSFSPG
jgi:hypothetical protein